MRMPNGAWEPRRPFKGVLDNYLQNCSPFFSDKFQFKARVSLKPQMTASWLYPICWWGTGLLTDATLTCQNKASSPIKMALFIFRVVNNVYLI